MTKHGMKIHAKSDSAIESAFPREGEHRMDQKEVDLNEEQELSPEELAEFMASYKKELARIYKMSSAKKSFMVRQKLPNLKMALEECDRDMRKDIDELKHKYGIHY